eukprot:11271194-Karenia_brevis.AAC.1
MNADINTNGSMTGIDIAIGTGWIGMQRIGNAPNIANGLETQRARISTKRLNVISPCPIQIGHLQKGSTRPC